MNAQASFSFLYNGFLIDGDSCPRMILFGWIPACM